LPLRRIRAQSRGMELRPEKPLSGVLAPLFALRGVRDLGVGDLGALREAVDWCAAQGLGVLQLLPVNETGSDHSPYNAISSVALDPLTIEITPETFPELSEAEIHHELHQSYEGGDLRGPVQYRVVKPLKHRLLSLAFERFNERSWRHNDKRARAFRSWMQQENAWLPGYCLFRVLMDHSPSREQWDRWPKALQNPETARQWIAQLTQQERKAWDVQMRRAAFIQWVAWTQWRAAKAYAEAKGVALMGDIPFGVSYYSADVFLDPSLFDTRWSCGAPPEPAFQQDLFTIRWGQNWGVPLYRWEAHRAGDYAWWRQRVRKVREVFHLFRIDHVLGFYRVYSFPWRPAQNDEFAPLSQEEARLRTGGELPHYIAQDDDTQEHKDLNRSQGEGILRVLLEETGEHRLIAEDLGNVPDYVRPSLHSLRIPGFKVPVWELDWDTSLVGGQHYPRLSVATYATHDHEPLRAMWERWMKAIAQGESGIPEDAALRDRTWWEVRRLGRWAGFEVPCILPFEAVHEGLLKGLLASNSWLAISMITDFFGTAQRFNVPGAISDANWSERLDQPVEAWSRDRLLAERMQRLASALERTGTNAFTA
jgi:4-alpha-glucanotransferase